jgi:hypothetical protein
LGAYSHSEPQRTQFIPSIHQQSVGRTLCDSLISNQSVPLGATPDRTDQSAARFCREHGELRDLLRCRRRLNQSVPTTTRRSRFTQAARITLGIMQAA